MLAAAISGRKTFKWILMFSAILDTQADVGDILNKNSTAQTLEPRMKTSTLEQHL